MKKIGILFIITLLSICCKQKEENVAIIAKPAEKQSIPKQQPKKALGDYMDCKENFLWGAKPPENTEFFGRVMFKEDVAHYLVDGQCAYTFFTNYQRAGTDKIELLWSYKTDCLRDDRGFLSKPNGVKHYPKTGDVFSEYRLVNDSVIKVKYNFPEWATAANRIAKDSIFPNYLYLEKHN